MTVDDNAIPRPAPSATGVEVGGEKVLLDRTTGSLHVLNDVGAEIWSRLDGSRTVGAIVAELSEAFGEQAPQVATDVHQFLARLARLGLIDGWISVGDAPPVRETSNGDSLSIDAVWVDWYTAQVVDALAARGIEAILLKGPAIRRWLYRDEPEARGYLDADLLVAPEALTTAEAVLSGLGFEREEGGGVGQWADSWRRAADGAVVDVHHTLQGCEHSDIEPWPILRASAVREEVGGTTVLMPSIAARALEVALLSPADRPWKNWHDLALALEQLSEDGWRETAALARALGVERRLGYRLSQSPAGASAAERIGLPAAPGWWLRWDADPMLAWAALLAELPSWPARLRLARTLVRPQPGYSYAAWAWQVLRRVPGAALTLLRSVRR